MADRIRLTAPVASKLSAHHLAPGKAAESLSFAFARLIRDGDDWIMTVSHEDHVMVLASDCFIDRNPGHVSVHTDVRAGVYCQAYEQGFDVVIDIHDHFFASVARFSSVDDRDDIKTAEWFRDRMATLLPGRPLYCVSMLLAQKDWAARRVGWDQNGNCLFNPVAVDLLGPQFRRHAVSQRPVLETHSRQVPAIGRQNQATIQSLRLAIVGAGGTGSIAIEAAARLGIGEIRVIDGDVIDTSNLNRLHGAGPVNVGENKAQWAAARATQLFPATRTKAIPETVFSEQAQLAVIGCDLVLVCVDNAETSWFMNRLCMQYAIPYWNVGVLIETNPQVVLHGRVNAVIPGLTACGECSAIRFFPRERPDQFLDMRTMEAQRSAGYVKNMPAETSTPATYALNQQIVGTLMSEVTSWLCGWWPLAHSLYCRSDRCDTQRVDLQNHSVAPASDCAVCSFLMGAAATQKLPRRGETIAINI